MSAICHVVRQFHPSVGGLESFVRNLALELTHRGHDCDVLTLDRVFREPHRRLPPCSDVSGLRVIRVPMIGHPRLFTPVFPNEILAPYDIVHVHGIDGMFDRAALTPRRPGQAFVATTHGLFFHTPWMRTAKQIYFHTITRAAAQRYDAIIATSGSDERMMRRVRADVVHIPNGVTPLPCSAHGRDLLSHGRLASHKRLDLVVNALADPSLRDCVLHIVGPEWDVTQASVREHAIRKGVGERVVLHGAVSAARLCEVASGCGAFLCASEYEGFGMALIEAFSAGMTAVVAPNASFTEIMRYAPAGKTTNFHEAASAAHAIRSELDRVTPAVQAAVRSYADKYSWQRNAARTLEVYEAAQTRQRVRAA